MKKTLIAGAAVLLLLTGCASAPDYAGLVAERFGDCLETLNVSAEDLTQVGDTVVVPIRPGVMLEWSVTTGNTGDVLTIPDEITYAELETAGCV